MSYFWNRKWKHNLLNIKCQEKWFCSQFEITLKERSTSYFEYFEFFQTFNMRIVGACSGKKTIQGTIQGNSSNNFGLFSMNTADVKARCSGILDSVNANLSSKGIPGRIVFCRFENHDGNRYFTVYVPSRTIFSII